MSSATIGHTRRRVPLTDDACPACGEAMRVSDAGIPVIVNGEIVSVQGVRHLACPSCGEVMLGREEARTAHEKGVDAYRHVHGLLTAEDIRELRQRLGLTQSQFAGLLRLGLNTVSRWESGRNVQNVAMDMLLRLVRDVPGSLDYLKGLAA
jgi:putative zinc finger/helix-turn-helix YgiT family protein